MGQKLTNEELLQKAIKTHGNTYDYSMSEYIDAHSKVKIICVIHNIFEQTASNHINGAGCPKCAVIKRAKDHTRTTDEFIEQAKEVHGDLYDYSLTEYIKSKEKIQIKCMKHGIFYQWPADHLRGCGCPSCNNENRSKTMIKPIADFIEEATIVHNDFYDYSLVKYIGIDTNIIIICPIHGKFEQTPYAHVTGHGCQLCGQVKGAAQILKTTSEYIDDAKGIHGDLYDYSLVKYTGVHNSVNYLWTKDPQASCFNVSLSNPVICPSSTSGFDTPQASIPAVPAVLGVAISPHHKILSAALTSLSCSAPH